MTSLMDAVGVSSAFKDPKVCLGCSTPKADCRELQPCCVACAGSPRLQMHPSWLWNNTDSPGVLTEAQLHASYDLYSSASTRSE